MRSSVAGALALFLSVLSISALDVPPNHAPPEMLVIPPNVTIMTPRTGNSAFENQIIDFGSAQNGFSELRHILQRQACSTGMDATIRVVAQRVHNAARAGAAARAATGYQCYRDAAGNPLCRNPNPPPPTSSDPPEPSTTYVPPPPPPTTEQETSTYVPPPPPPPDTRTVVIQTTQTQVVTQTYQVTQTPWPTQPPQQTRTFPPSSSPSRGTTSQAVQTGAVLGSETKTSVGAIAGGVVAGVVAVVVLILALVFWRRRQAKQAAATNVQPPPPPPNTVPPNPNPFISTGAVPPTPNSGDPFLTPMGQHQNLGVSYFNGVPASTNPPSGSNSGTGPYNASHYSGLPEPQQNEMSGSAMPMPMPRYDSTHPHPLPMTIMHSQQPQSRPQSQSQIPNARPWSGYTQSSGPYAENNNSQPSAWTPANNGWASPPPQTLAGSASPPYAEQFGTGAGGPPSTVYQPSSHLAYSPPGTPPGSPPLPGVYGGMAATASGGSGLPPGAAPPMNVYGSEKKSYVPYQ